MSSSKLLVVAAFMIVVLGAGRAFAGEDALAEVNAARAARGLAPYLRDDNLTAGAKHVADFRAQRMIEGHTGNDFGGLPVGTTASASGCAAWAQGMGWGSCCCYDHYRSAGACWAMGRDGRRYMHLFVR